MKKKTKRIFSVLLCFLFLFFVGCTDGGGGGGDDEESLGNPVSMEGVKVLSKPADYSFSDAVGVYSENYYNLFAREIINSLYLIYENPENLWIDENAKNLILGIDDENLNGNLDLTNGITYTTSNFESSVERYYLYDSLRYTIQSVSTTNDTETGDITQQVLTLADTSWKWTIGGGDPTTEGDGTNKDIFFINFAKNAPSSFGQFVSVGNSSSGYSVTVGNGFYSAERDEWTDLFLLGSDYIPSFSEFYTNDRVWKNEEEQITDYWISPYYQLENGETTATAVNFFQDALEYATYLFVLGYDYEIPEDAEYFNFNVVRDEATGLVTGMTVGGWEGEPISITDALGRVKEIYANIGGYVGLTDTNRAQIAQFIKDEVIGERAYSANTFMVTNYVNGVADNSRSLSFNRNYDAIIENIIDYACENAPIGTIVTEEGIETVTLSEPYLASQITDYTGDYFGAYWGEGSSGDGDDMFRHIPSAEYQSIVIYPNEQEFDDYFAENGVHQAIGDIWLAFEYYDDPTDSISPSSDKEYADSITINIGFRYYDHDAQRFTSNAECQKTIQYGHFPIDEDADDYEDRFESQVVIMSDSDFTEPDIYFGEEDIVMKNKFNRDIGGGVINPFANSTAVDGDYASITLTGSNPAKDYYMLNDSSTYGFYGTLNPTMFNGEDGCDYIEIYFDIVKDKSSLNTNYNFKVCVMTFLGAESV